VSIPAHLFSENLRWAFSISSDATVESLRAAIDQAEFKAEQFRQVAETNPNYVVRLRYSRRADALDVAIAEARSFVAPSSVGMWGGSREVRPVEGMQPCATPACDELIASQRQAYANAGRCEKCLAAFAQLHDNEPSAVTEKGTR
jgi:hypothetical protein